MSEPISTLAVKPWQYILLAFAAFLFLLPGIATLPPIDRDEARFVQASKQMLETGDYIDIKLQDQHRYKKPIGIYWLQSVAVKVTGGDETSQIWRYRLVSVFAGVASVLLITLTGARMFGSSVGLAAGVMLAGVFGLAFEGRIAKTDATLLVFTLMAQCALVHIYLAAKNGTAVHRPWPILLWMAVGIGVLIKGPLTLLIVALTVLGLVIFDKDRSWLRTLRPALGLVIIIAISAPWLIAITLKSDGAFWAESVGKDMMGKVASGQESHWGPPGYYMLTYSLYVWPFGYFAVLGTLAALNKWRDPRLLFCLAWYVPFWLILEATPTKLPHYPLPAYPAPLILAAWFLFGGGQNEILQKWQVWLGRLAALGVAIVTLGFVVIAIGLLPFSESKVGWSGLIAAPFAALAGWYALSATKTKNDSQRLISTSVFAAIFYCLAFSSVLPAAGTFWISRSVEQKLSEVKDCPNPHLASTSFHEPSLVFLNGTNTKLTNLSGAFEHLSTNDRCAFVLVPDAELVQLQALFGSQMEIVTIANISGFNYSKGTEISLALTRLVR